MVFGTDSFVQFSDMQPIVDRKSAVFMNWGCSLIYANLNSSSDELMLVVFPLAIGDEHSGPDLYTWPYAEREDQCSWPTMSAVM